MERVAAMLPGWMQSTKEDPYRVVREAFVAKGYRLVAPDITWRDATMSHWVRQFLDSVPERDAELTVWGYSLGALTGLIGAGSLKVDRLVLCSPSNYFREYMPLLPASDYVEMGARRMREFSSRSWRDVVSAAQVDRGVILAGERELAEYEDFRLWIDDLRSVTGWRLVVAKEADHAIASDPYQAALTRVMQDL